MHLEKKLWLPTRRELILTGGFGLLAGCGGGGSIPTPTPSPTPTPTPTPAPSTRHERFGFIENLGGGMYRLASQRLDGTDHQIVPLDPQKFIVAAHWSPDGKKIAYVTYDSTKAFRLQYSLFLLNADGSGHKFFANATQPRWSPDGKKLAYIVVEPSYGSLAAWNVETNSPAFGAQDPRPHATALGSAPDFVDIQLPRWRSNSEVWATYSASVYATPSAPGKSLWGLLRYFSDSGSLYLGSTERSIHLADFATSDGRGIVNVSNPSYGSYKYGDVKWLIGNDTFSLIEKTENGAGIFSPDGERLWINLNNGKGIRLYDRSLKEVGVPVIPNAAHISWFQT